EGPEAVHRPFPGAAARTPTPRAGGPGGLRLEGRTVNEDLLRAVRASMEASDLVRATSAVRQDGGRSLGPGPPACRPLCPEEVTRLESLGNCCDDWSRVRVAGGFDWRRVRHTCFHGDVVLGGFSALVPVAPGVRLPAGVYHSTVAGCVVGDNALVRD